MPVPVTVYWRPGCPFCRRLRGGLRGAGVRAREVNIWEDLSAAARVRSVTGGNETVPTVVVGEKALVNPAASTVMAEVRRAVPGFAPDAGLVRAAARMRALRMAQWVVIAGLIVASYTVEARGHSALSWSLDGMAVVVYLLFRLMLRRQEP
jgi:glutaredoxin